MISRSLFKKLREVISEHIRVDNNFIYVEKVKKGFCVNGGCSLDSWWQRIILWAKDYDLTALWDSFGIEQLAFTVTAAGGLHD